MTPEVKMINSIARRYAARCWWAELDDLVQEGWIALLTAQRIWDPSRNVPLAGYAGRAVMLHLRDYLWRMSAPVTGPSHHGERLAGLCRAPTDFLASHTQDDGPDMDAEQWWDELTARMETVIREADSSGAAHRVMWLHETPAQVATDLGLRFGVVHARIRAAWRHLRQDTRLRELMAARAQTC